MILLISYVTLTINLEPVSGHSMNQPHDDNDDEGNNNCPQESLPVVDLSA